MDGSVACLLTLLNFVVELKTQKGLVCAYEMNNLSRFFFYSYYQYMYIVHMHIAYYTCVVMSSVTLLLGCVALLEIH